MYKNMHRLQRGLSLVEVFVALLVLSVGLIALAKLQVDLVRGSSDARTRTLALALAEEKIEDLRTFARADGAGTWSVTANPMAWSYLNGPAITTPPTPPDMSCSPACTGGRIPPQTAYGSTLEVAGVRFKRTWEVDDRDFNNVASGITSRTKDARVTVAWINEEGVEQQVNVLANVVEIPPGNVALASQPVAERPDPPKVRYTPGLAPEIISVPIDTGTGKRETTKPLPDVRAHGYSNEVVFDVVNYHLEGSQNVVDRREEFVTVNCRCALAGPGRGRTPARVAFTGGVLRDAPGKVIISKPQTGVLLTSGSDGESDQPFLCNICCRDHHDGPAETLPDLTTDSNRYKPTAGSDHQHFLIPSTTPVTATGDAYDEACRLKRINGVFQVFEDWNLASILAMPENDLTITSIQEAYTAFVQDYVKNRANASLPTGTVPTFSTTTLVPAGAAQVSGRAIYIDRMPQNLVDFLNTSPPPDNFLSYVPFYEINLTKLANWKLQTISPDADYATVSGQLCDPRTVTQTALVGKIACIANQAILDETVLSVGLLQAYWRGTITAGPSAGQLDAQVYARTGNTGLTGTFALSSAESLATPVSSEYRFTVDAGQAISGTINKGTASGNPWSDVSVTAVGACSLAPATGNPSAKTFTCIVPSTWTGTVIATWTGHSVSASNNVFPPSTLPSSGVVSFVLIP